MTDAAALDGGSTQATRARSTRRVVFAPDSFKGSMGAADAARALAAGWRRADPRAELVLRPMADGGEGTLEAFRASVAGARPMPVTVTGPDDREVEASWLLLPAEDGTSGTTAVVELACTSGIELLDGVLRPWSAHTRGFGEAIAAALDAGASRLLLAIGSSSSTDAGLGMLTALGARVVDAEGRPVPPGAAGLALVHRIDTSRLRPLPPDGVAVLTDVTNPLSGPRGAAAVFGPQKGLTGEDAARVDVELERIAHLLPADPMTPGAGAAGGTGWALLSWGARLASGAESVADLIGLPDALARADVVVTGEGSYDSQSAQGKVPAHVARLAPQPVRVALVAGRIADDADVGAFGIAISLTELAGSPDAAMADARSHLETAGERIARAISP